MSPWLVSVKGDHVDLLACCRAAEVDDDAALMVMKVRAPASTRAAGLEALVASAAAESSVAAWLVVLAVCCAVTMAGSDCLASMLPYRPKYLAISLRSDAAAMLTRVSGWMSAGVFREFLTKPQQMAWGMT